MDRAPPGSTSRTLLARVKDPADAAAWAEFDARYRGLIVGYLRRRGVRLPDAEDLAQTVLTKLVPGLRSFQYDPGRGRFRHYLCRCIQTALADHLSRQAGRGTPVSLPEGQVAAECGPEVFELFEKEWVDHHYRLAVGRLRREGDARALRLLELTLGGTPVPAVGAELGMTTDAVHKAQQRLRDTLRAYVEEQIADEESPVNS